MEWLSQNWILVVFAVGVLLLMRRAGMGRGHAGGGHHRRGASHDNHRDGGRGGGAPTGPPAHVTDPVSGRTVDPRSGIASAYRGAPIYFESRENRDRFEASPEKFPIAPGAPPDAPRRRRGHC